MISPPLDLVGWHLFLRTQAGLLAREISSQLSPDSKSANKNRIFRLTLGGSLCCDAEHYEPGPRDQRAAENRNDVLVYSTKPVADDMEVTGPVTHELWIKSSAVDTDLTAKLVDVSPEGFAMSLTDGILRMRYRDSQEKPTLLSRQ